MNWIEITPETELPKKDVEVLVSFQFSPTKNTVMKGFFVDSYLHNEPMLFESDCGLTYVLNVATHYCIITTPKQ